jgi:hypothetical protein
MTLAYSEAYVVYSRVKNMTCSCVGCVNWVQPTSSTLCLIINKWSGGQNFNVHMFGLALGLSLNEVHDADGKE